jgi:dihydrofolate reductase
MIGAFRIVGYVIASADGRIADASGHHPASLSLDADRRFFENGLDHVDAVVHGRHSHEGHPNSARRRRLILTRSVPALAPDPRNARARLWNPAGASFEEACAALDLNSGTIAIIGGPLVYTLFLKRGYDNFHLSRAVNVWIPDGLPVFIREVPGGGEPEAALTAAGLKAGPTLWLDDEVTVTDWERTSPPP